MNVDPGHAHFEIVVQDDLAFCRDHRAHFKAPRTALDAAPTTGAKPPIANPIHARRRTRVLNISV